MNLYYYEGLKIVVCTHLEFMLYVSKILSLRFRHLMDSLIILQAREGACEIDIRDFVLTDWDANDEVRFRNSNDDIILSFTNDKESIDDFITVHTNELNCYRLNTNYLCFNLDVICVNCQVKACKGEKTMKVKPEDIPYDENMQLREGMCIIGTHYPAGTPKPVIEQRIDEHRKIEKLIAK